MCIDFRRLNVVTKRDYHVLPDIREVLQTMSGSKYFTALDLIRGFWALPVVERDPQKTAFTGPDGDSKLERRALRLEEFDFEVEHLPGEQNVVADHLSRQVPHLMAGSVTAVAGHLTFATAGRILDVAGNGGDVQDPRA